MTKERLLIARSAEMQLQLARDLLRKASQNLASLRHGVQPGLDAARKALAECEKAEVCTTRMIDRIPVDPDESGVERASKKI